jgi:hypothetical protein
MKIISHVIMFIGALIIIQSCKDDAINPTVSSTPSFSVSIAVVDTNGNPVPRIRISCWNKLLPISGSLPAANDTLPRTPASSKIRLNMPAKARVWMALYNMDNRILLALYSDNTLWGPGILRADYVTGEYRPPWVLKCRCIARDSLSNVVYCDSVYTLCWQPYPERSILGYTSASGRFSTTDSLFFPNVFALPPLVHTGDSSSDALGTFALSDTLNFALTDTASHKQQFYEGVVHKAVHDSLTFVWNPTSVSKPESFCKQQTSQLLRVGIEKPAMAGSSWKLNQNYPNPYYR